MLCLCVPVCLQRTNEIETLRDTLDDLRLQVEPLLRTKPVPRLFVKAKPDMDRDEAEANQPDINKWSVYSAYRYPAIMHWLNYRNHASLTFCTFFTVVITTISTMNLCL